MRIFHFLSGVIFVLSTVVLVTHCCSSRIVLQKDRPIHVVEEEQEQQNYQQQQQESLIIEQTDESLLNNEERRNNQSETLVAVKSVVIIDSSAVLNKTERSLLDPGPKSQPHPDTNMAEESQKPPIHAAEFITDPAVRAQQAGNPEYHVIDVYFTIMRDVLSFECTGQFLTDFCLNKGRCFRYPIGNHSFYSCECADGYVGERCESKSLNDFLMPTTFPKTLDVQNPKILTARIVFSFPMLIALSSIYLMVAAMIVFRCPRKD